MLVNNSDFYVLLHLTVKNAVIEIISLVGDFRGQYVGETALSDDRLVITNWKGHSCGLSQLNEVNTTFLLVYERSITRVGARDCSASSFNITVQSFFNFHTFMSRGQICTEVSTLHV